jgi:hypothetical protein
MTGKQVNVSRALNRIIVLEVVKRTEVFHHDLKTECQNNAEVLATTQVKEEATHS